MSLQKRISEITAKLKAVAKIYSEHYVVITSTIFIVFTGYCYLYTASYYSNFGVNFYNFGSLKDVYQAPLTGDIWVFIYGIFVVALSCLLVVCKVDQQSAVNPVNFNALRLLSIVIGATAIVILPIFLIVATPKTEALKIKDGFTARYTIHTDNASIDCLAMVGSTSDYIVFWDGRLAQANIISRSSVVKFVLVMEPPPNKYLMLHRKGPSPTQADLNKLIEQQQQWSEKLKEKCDVTVAWPQHEPIEPFLFQKMWSYTSNIFKY